MKQKINRQSIKKQIDFSCPFCEGRVNFLYKINRFAKDFNIYHCEGCDLSFQWPLPNEEEIEMMYGKDYYLGKSEYSYEDERKSYSFYSKVWKARVKKLLKSIKTEEDEEEKRFLDIGCSFGGLIRNAQEQNFKGYGIEISDYSRSYANQFLNGRVYKTLEKADFKNNFFDAISMIEVIEHVRDPKFYFNEAYRILKKGGIFMLQTANMQSRQAMKAKSDYHYFLPGHLFYFSASGLKKELIKSGFSKVKIFRPVEFSLLAKLLKSRGSFVKATDYFKWFKIAYYHFKSFFHFGNFSLTASMVIYAWK